MLNHYFLSISFSYLIHLVGIIESWLKRWTPCISYRVFFISWFYTDRHHLERLSLIRNMWQLFWPNQYAIFGSDCVVSALLIFFKLKLKTYTPQSLRYTHEEETTRKGCELACSYVSVIQTYTFRTSSPGREASERARPRKWNRILYLIASICVYASLHVQTRKNKFISANTSTKDTSFSLDFSLLFRCLNLLDLLVRAPDVVALSLDASAFASVSVGSALVRDLKIRGRHRQWSVA